MKAMYVERPENKQAAHDGLRSPKRNFTKAKEASIVLAHNN